ncbi:C40 family peptidase [Paenibacillus sp. MB22_1]|uniref:C40 family peptidase n=1 Tax=unclassified Paenibacillus TaxID=185978 RepID=UPI0001AFCDAD|nr:C40 family peptidase [Paenibacillus sp. oral taxon 786]EES73371.1 NlpC/P60 family protein [Paenibacillus sp. oral taxon 786 str. D14]
MKKLILSALGAALIFSASATSSFASSVKLENEVDKVVGTPYLYGGTTVAGFDCSGFILYIFDKFKLDLPRTSKSQAKEGTPVDQDNLRAGDLVFFNTDGKGISHAGIYIGDNKFAHSSSSKGVRISSLSESYYKNRYVTARRVVSEQSYLKMIGEE